MIQRLKFLGWSRWLHIVLGLAMVVGGIADRQWILSIAGAYFVAKGYFGWGCNSCSVPLENSEKK